MNTTESITWTSKKAWGAVGLTHRADVTIGDDTYSFTLDQPRKGFWVARGRKNGTSCLYREGDTLTRVRDEVTREVTGLRRTHRDAVLAALDEITAAQEETADGHPDLDEPECWCHWVDIGVGEQRASEVAGCPQHDPYEDGPLDGWTDPEADLVFLPVVPAFASLVRLQEQIQPALQHDLISLRTSAWAFNRRCACPTPTHRMSCGVGATPKVVRS